MDSSSLTRDRTLVRIGFVPGSDLTLAASVVLGLVEGTAAVSIGATIGMIPGTLLYVHSGKVAGELAALAGSAAPSRGAGYYAVVGFGFAATAIVTLLATRIARRAPDDATAA